MTELLAPAGSREAFIAALESGADAVYLGGRQFGARHYAPNFSDEELAEAVRTAHLRGVLVYVTVNTLLDDSEISAMAEYLRHLYAIGVDAIIVQDVGVAKIAQTVTPDLPLHASTQMTVYNLAGAEFLAAQGFTRVVLARELSLADIRYICENSPIEIEVFIHGALCICYSGQCLMSSMIGGRSGNRGKCAQPCRLPYSLVNEQGAEALAANEAGEYLLSPKDLCTIEIIPELIAAGVASLKIEGRMKRAEYVAVVVDGYRRAIDGYAVSKQYKVPPEDIQDMAQVFNRGFTLAYLQNRPGKLMMSDRRPNNRGTQLGRVISYDHKSKAAVIKLDESLSLGDVIEFWVKVGGRINVTVNSLIVDGQQSEDAKPGDEATVNVPTPVRSGDRVFKTFDNRLIQKARAFFSGPSPLRRVPVDIVVKVSINQPLTVSLKDNEGNCGHGKTGFIAQQAIKRPLDYDTVAKQISRLGTTIFSQRSLDIDINGSVMVPVSEINEARRQAVDELIAARLSHFSRAALDLSLSLDRTVPKVKYTERTKAKPLLVVNVDDPDKAEAALSGGADVVMFGGENYNHKAISADDYRQVVALARNKEKSVILSTPRIVRESQTACLISELKLFSQLSPDAVSVGNIGTIQLLKEFPALNICGDYHLNIYNSLAIDFFAGIGLNVLTLSPELNFAQLEQLNTRKGAELECLVHGFLPLMVSEYCLPGSYLGNVHAGKCSMPCQKEKYWLKDRKNEKFPIVTDQFCRMHVLNAKELSLLPHVAKLCELGINRLRIEAKAYNRFEIAKITRLYRELIDQGENHPLYKNDGFKTYEGDNITRGHYFRGVL